MKRFIAVGVLTLGSLSLASAKSYEINISSPTKAGSVDLKPGKYKVTVEGANATFVEQGKSKGVSVPVKVKEAPKKFNDTRVQSAKEGSVDKITAIDLGGTATSLEF